MKSVLLLFATTVLSGSSLVAQYTELTNPDLMVEDPLKVAIMNYSDGSKVLRYKKFELGVILPEPFDSKLKNFEVKQQVAESKIHDSLTLNPFLEWELDVEAHFRKLNESKEIVVNGFYTTEVSRNMRKNDWTIKPSNFPMRIRFAPPTNGTWECYITVKVKNKLVVTSSVFPFTVVESGSLGFTSLHENNRNLVRGGKIIFPVGQNFAGPIWQPSDQKLANTGWDKPVLVNGWKRMMDSIENYIKLGGKYIRTNQLVSGSLLEWEKKGNYFSRMNYAWEQDKLLELLEKNDVLMLFTLMNQEPFMLYGNYDMWSQDWDYYLRNVTDNTFYRDTLLGKLNPYNDNPGVKLPHDMFLDESDLRYHEQRTRYYLARYGYSTSIYAWELISEPFHLDQMKDEPYFIKDHPQHEVVLKAVYNYSKTISKYMKEDLQLENQLLMVNGVSGSWNPWDKLTYQDSSIYLNHVDMIGLNFYSTSPEKYLVSFTNEANENGMTRCILDYVNSCNKPVFLSECGSGDLTLECGMGAGEKQDVMTMGFANIAGFNMWQAIFKNEYGAYQAQIKACNFMNSKAAPVLEAGNGNWTQHRQREKQFRRDKRPIKESQYYVGETKLNAVGYLRNRCYNVVNSLDTTLAYCASFANPYDIYNENRSINATDGRFNAMMVEGLEKKQKFRIEYYSNFSESNTLPLLTEDQISSRKGTLILNHPVLSVENPVLPLVWFVVVPVNE